MLHGQTLPKNTREKFEEIKVKINRAWINLANVIAKYREEMMGVLKSNEAEWAQDETTLNGLITELEEKKTNELGPDLWKTPPYKIDLSENDPIINFWKDIVDNSDPKLQWKPDTNPAAPWDITNVNTKITEALNSIQFLHDDWDWNRENTWKLFKGSSTEMTDINKTLKNPLISTLLNQTDPTKVKDDVENFVKSVWKTKWNAFYIQSQKLFTNEQREIAIRMSLYIYCAYKIVNDPEKVTKELCDDITEKLNQIIDKEIPKIKWLHNTKVELWYLKPEYETLRDLNTKLWDIDLWSHNLTPTTQSFIQDLTPEYEAWIATNIEKYELKESDVNVTDAAWTTYAVSFLDSIWNTWDLICNLTNTKPVDFHIDVWWHKIKIWKLVLSNLTWNAKLKIEIDDEARINAAFAAAWVAMPTLPIDFDMRVKWIKTVNNGLKGCCASLTKSIKLKLASAGAPFIPLWPTVDVEASISNVTEISREEAERVAEEQLRERYEDLPWYNPDRINLFLRRDYIKEKYVRKIMKDGKWFSWHDRDINATERQQLQKSQDKIFDDDIQTIDIQTKCPNTYTQLDNLCRSFIWTPPTFTSAIKPPEFQKKFADIINFDPPYDKPGILEVIWKERALTYSSNILIRLNMFVDHQRLVTGITNDIATITDDTLLEKSVRDRIKKYMDSYNDLPRFLEATGIKLEDANFWTNVRNANAALLNIQAQTMKLKMNVIKEWSAAYKIKQKKWFIAKTWDVIDSGFFKKQKKEMPLWLLETLWWTRWIARTWWIIAATTVWWLLFWPLWATLTSAATVWLRTLFSKYSHYTKEYEWQMKNEAVDLANYEAERSRLQAAVWWKKWYNTNRLWWKDRKDARHRNRYVRTTHGRSAHTINLANSIKSITNQNTALNPAQEWQLKKLVAEWYARLKYYKTTWQNFLWSDDVNYAEEDYRYLYAKLIAWAKRLWWMDAANPNKIDEAKITWDPNYNATMNVLKSWYEQAISRFKGKRAALWIWNAAVTWAIAWWVSYLSTKFWWKKFWKWDEHNFVNPWDSSPTDPIVNVEKWWWSSSLQDVYASGMSANPGARWYKLIVSPEIDAITTWPGTSHTFTNLQDYINDVRAMIPASDTKTLEAFNKATALHSPLPPRYKRSALEKAIAYASNNWADVWNQYLFGERFVANIESGLNARTAAGTTGVPIDNIVFWRKAATVISSTPWSAWSLTERSMNWVIKIKTWGPGVWVPISRNTFKRHEWKVKPGSTAHP